MKATTILGHIGSCLVGLVVTLAVFGLTLAAAWLVVLEDDSSLRLMGAALSGALGIFAGGFVVGILGRANRIKRSVIFTVLLCSASFIYLFAISQATALFIVVGALIGLLAGATARWLRRSGPQAGHETSEQAMDGQL